MRDFVTLGSGGESEDLLRIPVEPALDGALADELRTRVLFVDARIEGFNLVTEPSGAVSAVVLCGRNLGDGDIEALRQKISALLELQVRPQVAHPPKVLWRSGHRRSAGHDAFAQLQASGWAMVQGEGQVAIAGPMLDLVRVLDRLLVQRLREHYEATEYSYPTLIRSQTLQEGGYFASFPHHLMFVTRLHNDLDVYLEFERGLSEASPLDGLLEHCRNVDYCLPPTMCFHTFAQYQGQSLGGFSAVTAAGKSFRYESGYHRTLERLWDFTIREMVFLGTRDEVLTARRRVLEAMQSLMDELELEARCEVANDPFFGSDAVPDAVGSQRMLEMKYELRLPAGLDADIAVGSFNFHDDIFGKRFKIVGEDGKYIRSACVGFGLERFAFAVLSRHGLIPAKWPRPLADGQRRLAEG